MMSFVRAIGRLIRAIWLLSQADDPLALVEPHSVSHAIPEPRAVPKPVSGSVDDVIDRHASDLYVMRQILQAKIALAEAGRQSSKT